MLFTLSPPKLSSLSTALNETYRMDETACIEKLLAEMTLSDAALLRIHNTAYKLVDNMRKDQSKKGSIEAFLKEYDLSSEEGIALMCLAEALLRIPDKATVDLLIRDKIGNADWESHLKQSDSLFVNATTWALMITGKIINQEQNQPRQFSSSLKRFATRAGEPVIRSAISQAMKILGSQFVMEQTIEAAVKRARESEAIGYRYSYDMLGEAARTAEDARRYYQAYEHAIKVIGKASAGKGFTEGPGISIKLSALHPRYELTKRERVLKELVPQVTTLILQAKNLNIGVTIDAEESERLDLSLEIFEKIFAHPELKTWPGLGLAVQAYQKRASIVLDYLIDLSERYQRRIMVRLVKGAYWDSEIKRSQVNGLEGYPVFTRKASTDISYLACAQKMLKRPDVFFPQFATHNAYSVAAILEMAGDNKDFEFQCLHGMGQALYNHIVGNKDMHHPCRIYAPVGGHEDLLAYLVRRLLENGANTSFVNRIVDEKTSINDVIADPLLRTRSLEYKPHPKISIPRHIYGDHRLNSIGIDLSNQMTLEKLAHNLNQFVQTPWRAEPLIATASTVTAPQALYSPSLKTQLVGDVCETSIEQVAPALDTAIAAAQAWDKTPVEERAACLERMADLLEKHNDELMALAIREAGKTIADAIAEVREAVDFCRYYAVQARELMAKPQILVGPTGEHNQLSLHGRGAIVCISPWNFPLAIFIGQVSAALVSGNTVLAKPAEQTPLIAAFAVSLFYEAGIPRQVLQYLPGRGETIGAALIADPRIAGVMFTGSTQTARLINQTLAKRESAIIPFIAETGGQNAMIVDSSALLEQAVNNVVISAFGSAGQRCSALRVLYVQQDIADKFISMLQGAMAELEVGNPDLLSTDIGPVIDADAYAMLSKHVQQLKEQGRLIYQTPLPSYADQGYYFPPTVFEINSIEQLTHEVFGPILHIIRYNASDLNRVIADINHTGFGLTLGVHSRINETVDYVKDHVHVGNIYVNRSMIGAVVGVQPFGGERLSGTGPKAGGPHYLPRLCVERSLSIDTTAASGNAALISLDE